MSLSYSKMEKLLFKKGLFPKKKYVIDNSCVYIEVLCVSNSEIILVYIPSKYDIKVEKGDDVYDIKYLDISVEGSIPNDYAIEPDNFDLEQVYEQIDINENIDLDNKNIETKLKENYKHPISLKDMNKNQITELKNSFRQLERFKFCIKGLKYKLAICYKNYICCIRRDDTFEGFAIKDYLSNEYKKLNVIIDLETLYSSKEPIDNDILTLKDGIYKILNKNQIKHSKILQKMLEEKKDILKKSEIIYLKKEKYFNYQKKLRNMLEQIIDSEKQIIEKIYFIKQNNNSSVDIKGLHNDVENIHIIGNLEKELENIANVKKEIMNNIFDITNKLQTLSLQTDSVFFDNSVMLDTILKNFSSLDITSN